MFWRTRCAFASTTCWIGSFAARLDQTRPYTTREFLYLLGKEIGGEAKEDGIVSAGGEGGVPLFCPAMADSSIGIGVAERRHRGENKLMFDMMADVLEITNIVADSPATGVIYFGGGTPKNYVQQTEVVAMLMNRRQVRPPLRGTGGYRRAALGRTLRLHVRGVAELGKTAKGRDAW